MSAPAVTIVMPAYNAAATIAAAIRSVLAQTRGDFELIVVDDGSRDDTAGRVAPFEADPRVRLLKQGNRGLAKTRNEGIAHGRGELVSLLDSDDLWMPTYLEEMTAALERDPGAAMAYTDAWMFDDASKRVYRPSAMAYQDPPARAPADPQTFLAELVDRNFVFTSATIRRAVLDEVGAFRESLQAAEDYDLWLRIAAGGHRATLAPGRLAVYRKRAGSLSTNEPLMTASLREVLRAVAEEYDVSTEVRERARARLARLDAALLPDGRLTAIQRVRSAGARLKWALLGRLLLYRTPPPEVAAAFPDLASV